MTDEEIICLLEARDEAALRLTQGKYGAYCKAIARNILGNPEDAEECENETLFKLWNAIPPAKPRTLKAFIGKIARNTALDSYERGAAAKRGGGQAELALLEIGECLGYENDFERIIESGIITAVLNRFLSSLPKQQRIVFLKRYWFFIDISEIASELDMSESKVKSVLFRLRKKLKIELEKEDIMP